MKTELLVGEAQDQAIAVSEGQKRALSLAPIEEYLTGGSVQYPVEALLHQAVSSSEERTIAEHVLYTPIGLLNSVQDRESIIYQRGKQRGSLMKGMTKVFEFRGQVELSERGYSPAWKINPLQEGSDEIVRPIAFYLLDKRGQQVQTEEWEQLTIRSDMRPFLNLVTSATATGQDYHKVLTITSIEEYKQGLLAAPVHRAVNGKRRRAS